MKWSIPEKIIERGRHYVDGGRVLSITADPELNVWHATVLGSEPYQVELDGSTKEQDHCTCPYWQDHGFCKHTVAVELALRKIGHSRVLAQNQHIALPVDHDSVFSQRFTERFKLLQERDLHQPQMMQTNYQIEFHVDLKPIHPLQTDQRNIQLWLKIGEKSSKKRYVIRNISDFLQSWEMQDNFQQSRQHTFSMNHANFDEQDQQSLQASLRILEGEQLLEMEHGSYVHTSNERYLVIPPTVMREFLQLLQESSAFFLHFDDQVFRQLTFQPLKDHTLLEFTFTKQAERYVLTLINNEISAYLPAYQSVFANGTFSTLTYEQKEIYELLVSLLKRTKTAEIVYTHETLPSFFQAVLPVLEKIAVIEIADEIWREVIIEPLICKFWLQRAEQGVFLRREYHYGSYVFSSDPKISSASRKNDLQVIRDTYREEKISLMLTRLAFHPVANGFLKKLNTSRQIYYFFTEELAELKRFGQVELADNVSELFLSAEQYQPEIQVNELDSWLDIHFDISGIAANEIDAVLNSLMNHETYHALGTGQILDLTSPAFQETGRALNQIQGTLRLKNGSGALPRYRALLMQQALGDLDRVTFGNDFEKMVAHLTHPDEYPVSLPAGLEATLREYQVSGFRWLSMLSHYQFGGILADDMGLGKTIQAITYLLAEKEAGRLTQPVMIVAPASLIYNWQVECQKFAPSLTTKVVYGTKKQREAILNADKQPDIFITSYNSLRADLALYQQQSFSCLILDEAQMVKNSATKTFHALQELQVVQRFALSGTPVENNLNELWSLFQILMPGFFPSKKAFKQLTVEEISRMIQPFVLRREKSNVLKDLPEKIETNLYSALSNAQKKVYLAYLRQTQTTIEQMKTSDFQKNRISILAALTRLRQICCDPALFMEDFQGDSGKLEQLKELLAVAQENKRRVLLFSQFTGMLRIIEKELQEQGIQTFYLHGGTRPVERLEMVDRFNAGERDVFLISLKAGGTGLNLTGADTVILYDLWWNPAVEEQAAGRAHRLGQKKVVEVWRLIAEGTIEEKMYALQQEKKQLFQQVLNGEDLGSLSQLTEEDIRTILSIGE